MLKLLSDNGVRIDETYQLDVGGGTESVDTMDRTRDAKRTIKTESVAASIPYKAEIVAGSTDYVDFLQNKRDSYFWISGVYFCNAPMKIDLKFQTVDAPNAGSVLFDVVRAVKLALNKKLNGAVESVCAYGFKRPPQMVSLEEAEKEFKKFLAKLDFSSSSIILSLTPFCFNVSFSTFMVLTGVGSTPRTTAK